MFFIFVFNIKYFFTYLYKSTTAKKFILFALYTFQVREVIRRIVKTCSAHLCCLTGRPGRTYGGTKSRTG